MYATSTDAVRIAYVGDNAYSRDSSTAFRATRWSTLFSHVYWNISSLSPISSALSFRAPLTSPFRGRITSVMLNVD